VIDSCDLHAVDRDVLERAAALAPAQLRGLDAIHLATAMPLGALAAYDRALVEAAQAADIPVIGPVAGTPTG
jgi:predicted nucleic acid-binding protein